MSANIASAIKECEELSSSIMEKIDTALSSNDISFIHSNKSEIITENTSKEDIIDIILNIDDVNESNFKLLLQITESNEKVYIRQKFN